MVNNIRTTKFSSSVWWRTLGRVVNCQVRAVSGTLTQTGTAYSLPALIQMSSDPWTLRVLVTSETSTTGAHSTLHGIQHIRWYHASMASWQHAGLFFCIWSPVCSHVCWSLSSFVKTKVLVHTHSVAQNPLILIFSMQHPQEIWRL